MIPEAQRIAIAQACGWTRCNIDEPMSGYEPGQGMPGLCILPDYLNSLDAMHEAWLKLSPFQRDRFESELYAVLVGEAEYNRNDDAGFITNATSAQRAEAFLRTLYLWVDSSESAS
jgi:hypothetical protein